MWASSPALMRVVASACCCLAAACTSRIFSPAVVVRLLSDSSSPTHCFLQRLEQNQVKTCELLNIISLWLLPLKVTGSANADHAATGSNPARTDMQKGRARYQTITYSMCLMHAQLPKQVDLQLHTQRLLCDHSYITETLCNYRL